MSDVAPAAGSDAALSAAPDGLISAGDAWIAQAVGVGALSLANATTLSPVGDLLDAAARRLLHGLDETVRYEHRDHLGSVASVTDEAGQQVQRTQYYPFGALRHVTGDEPEQGYTGKERDDTGLVHFGARYLDPLAGRWDAPDPHFDVSGPEQADRLAESLCDYSFMLGRPLCGVDQNGELVVALLVVAVVAAVAVSAGGLSHLDRADSKALGQDSYLTAKYKQLRGVPTNRNRESAADRRAREAWDSALESSVAIGDMYEASFNSGPRVFRKQATAPMKATSTVTVTAEGSVDTLSKFDSWRADRMSDGGVVGGIVGLFSSNALLKSSVERRLHRDVLRRGKSISNRMKQREAAATKRARAAMRTPGGPTPGGPRTRKTPGE